MSALKYKSLVKELFEVLDYREETDEGRMFSPTVIRSCRVDQTTKIERVLKELKDLSDD